MVLQRVKSWLKNLYSSDSERELKTRYEQMSNLELANLLAGEGLRAEAAEIARNIIMERVHLNSDFTPADVFDVELNRLTARSRMCHICGERSPSEKHEFLMCQKAGTKVNWPSLISGAALNLVSVPFLGVGVLPVGNTSQRYHAVRLNLCLCGSCARQTKYIEKDMCTSHPLAEFYTLCGFSEVMWPSELEPC